MARKMVLKKQIITEMVHDWIPPYDLKPHNFIPIVKSSTHPRFTPNTRFDWGCVKKALNEGYQVIIYPHYTTAFLQIRASKNKKS